MGREPSKHWRSLALQGWLLWNQSLFPMSEEVSERGHVPASGLPRRESYIWVGEEVIFCGQDKTMQRRAGEPRRGTHLPQGAKWACKHS